MTGGSKEGEIVEVVTLRGDTLFKVSDGNGEVNIVDAFTAGTGNLARGDTIPAPAQQPAQPAA